jgi:hypothetical protein
MVILSVATLAVLVLVVLILALPVLTVNTVLLHELALVLGHSLCTQPVHSDFISHLHSIECACIGRESHHSVSKTVRQGRVRNKTNSRLPVQVVCTITDRDEHACLCCD